MELELYCTKCDLHKTHTNDKASLFSGDIFTCTNCGQKRWVEIHEGDDEEE